MTKEAVGKTTNGHQLRAALLAKRDSFIEDTTAAVSSSESRISFVMLLTCVIVLEWSSNFATSSSVAVFRRSTPFSRVSWRWASAVV